MFNKATRSHRFNPYKREEVRPVVCLCLLRSLIRDPPQLSPVNPCEALDSCAISKNKRKALQEEQPSKHQKREDDGDDDCRWICVYNGCGHPAPNKSALLLHTKRQYVTLHSLHSLFFLTLTFCSFRFKNIGCRFCPFASEDPATISKHEKTQHTFEVAHGGKRPRRNTAAEWKMCVPFMRHRVDGVLLPVSAPTVVKAKQLLNSMPEPPVPVPAPAPTPAPEMEMSSSAFSFSFSPATCMSSSESSSMPVTPNYAPSPSFDAFVNAQPGASSSFTTTPTSSRESSMPATPNSSQDFASFDIGPVASSSCASQGGFDSNWDWDVIAQALDLSPVASTSNASLSYSSYMASSSQYAVPPPQPSAIPSDSDAFNQWYYGQSSTVPPFNVDWSVPNPISLPADSEGLNLQLQLPIGNDDNAFIYDSPF